MERGASTSTQALDPSPLAPRPSPLPLNITRLLRIHGLVQGVFFRESMRLRANELNVAGWVRNRSDGSVEAMVQGAAFDVERLIEWARHGPAAARVATVDIETPDEETGYRTFDKKPSL